MSDSKFFARVSREQSLALPSIGCKQLTVFGSNAGQGRCIARGAAERRRQKGQGLCKDQGGYIDSARFQPVLIDGASLRTHVVFAGCSQESRVSNEQARANSTPAFLHSSSANMTMGIDMSPLFSEVVACMNIQALDIKKMVRSALTSCTYTADINSRSICT